MVRNAAAVWSGCAHLRTRGARESVGRCGRVRGVRGAVGSIGAAGGSTRQEGEHVVHVGLIEMPLQLGGSAQGFDFTIHHDRNAVAIFRLVHIVVVTKIVMPLRRLVNELPKLPPRSSVNAARRFV